MLNSDLFSSVIYLAIILTSILTELLMLKMLDQLQQPLQLRMHAYRTINSATENIPIPTKRKNIRK